MTSAKKKKNQGYARNYNNNQNLNPLIAQAQQPERQTTILL